MALDDGNIFIGGGRQRIEGSWVDFKTGNVVFTYNITINTLFTYNLNSPLISSYQRLDEAT